MAYRPIPNTVPHRVIQFLSKQPKGAAISTAVLAEAVDHDAGSMAGCLSLAKKLMRDPRLPIAQVSLACT